MNPIPGHDVIDCPKCREPMRHLKAGDIVIDRCEKCYGIWLDDGERAKLLKDRSLVTGADIGPAAAGGAGDAGRAIACPRCSQAMTHVRDRTQAHVGFEQCPECHGCFFDAGELRDLSEYTLMERLRSLTGRA